MCKWGNPFYLTFYFQAAAGPKDYGAALNHDPATLPLLQTIDPFVMNWALTFLQAQSGIIRINGLYTRFTIIWYWSND